MDYPFRSLGDSQPNFELLAEAWRRVNELDKQGRFNLDDIVERQPNKTLECGAICCVVGMACLDPTFPSAGWFINRHLRMDHPTVGEVVGGLYDIVGSQIFNVSVSDAEVLFGASDAAIEEDQAYTGPESGLSDLQAFQQRLQAFFDHYGQPWPADIPRI